MRTVASGALALLAGTVASFGGIAQAQKPAQAPATATPGPAQAPVAPGTPAPPSALAPTNAPGDTPLPIPTELTQARPGGLTAAQVAARAGATSWNAKASEESLRGAAARVDEAWASFLPRLQALGKYTRLSDFKLPAIQAGQIVGTLVPPGGSIGSFNQLVPVSLVFPFFVLDNWLIQESLTVPISDYFLRIDQNYTSATRSQDAARWDVVTQRATSQSNGAGAYYTWLRARGSVIVAIQALNDQKTHLRDARNQFNVGNASKADVLRAETAEASAELALERTKNLADLSEKQMRVAMHAKDDEVMLPGEDLESTVPSVQGNVQQMIVEALANRPEIKSADANADSAREQSKAAKAGRYPSLSAFGDVITGNPNPRYIPPTNVFNTTWDVGAQLTWSPNDILTANGSSADAASRAAAIIANKGVVRDGIEVEVTQALQGVREADFSIETSGRELASAEEAYRVARELFNNGRGTSTTLTDAETDLTRARLDLLNSKADARITRIRLDHALGRDAKVAP
jgi:outer membrane protein TolC